MLSQALANQSNQVIVVPTQALTFATKVKDFMRMKPLESHGSKMKEDPIDFIAEAYRVIVVMGIPS